MMTRITKKKITTLALIGGLFVASYLTLKYVVPLIWPFILAYAIALLVHPIVKFLVEKLHFHKNAATILTMCFTMLGIGAILFFVVNGKEPLNRHLLIRLKQQFHYLILFEFLLKFA